MTKIYDTLIKFKKIILTHIKHDLSDSPSEIRYISISNRLEDREMERFYRNLTLDKPLGRVNRAKLKEAQNATVDEKRCKRIKEICKTIMPQIFR